MGEIGDNEFEPVVPSNLGNLNAPLKSFTDFLRIDSDLITVAEENSASMDNRIKYQKKLKSWIKSFSEKGKDEILFRLIKDHDPHLGAELRQQFQQTVLFEDRNAMPQKPRTVGDLLEKAEAYAIERKRRIAEQKAKERARKNRQKATARKKYLNELEKREDEVWKKVNDLIQTLRPVDYDEAVKLLVDLRDLNKEIDNDLIFKDKMRRIYEKHHRKSSFIGRLKKNGLDLK